jgi:hypothetical protein
MNDVDEMLVSERNLTIHEEVTAIERDYGDTVDGVYACNRWVLAGAATDYSCAAISKADAAFTPRGKSLVRTDFTYGFVVHHTSSSAHRRILFNIPLVNAHHKRWRSVNRTIHYPYISRFAPVCCTSYSPCGPGTVSSEKEKRLGA